MVSFYVEWVDIYDAEIEMVESTIVSVCFLVLQIYHRWNFHQISNREYVRLVGKC